MSARVYRIKPLFWENEEGSYVAEYGGIIAFDDIPEDENKPWIFYHVDGEQTGFETLDSAKEYAEERRTHTLRDQLIEVRKYDFTDQEYIQCIDEFPDVWWNKDAEQWETKTEEAAEWFATHHKILMSILINTQEREGKMLIESLKKAKTAVDVALDEDCAIPKDSLVVISDVLEKFIKREEDDVPGFHGM